MNTHSVSMIYRQILAKIVNKMFIELPGGAVSAVNAEILFALAEKIAWSGARMRRPYYFYRFLQIFRRGGREELYREARCIYVVFRGPVLVNRV